MQVSGSLKVKMIQFYRDAFISFDLSSCETREFNSLSPICMSYDGEVSFVPWDQDRERKLKKRQEIILEEKIKETLSNKRKRFYFSSLEEIFNVIRKTPRNQSILLIETLNKILNISSNYEELFSYLDTFKHFIFYLRDVKDVKENDLEIMIKCLLNKDSFQKENIKNYKIKNYHFDPDNLNPDLKDILAFGEFMNPKRIITASTDFKRETTTAYLGLPIFFLIENERDAIRWYLACKQERLTKEKLKKQIEDFHLPEQYLSLTRKL